MIPQTVLKTHSSLPFGQRVCHQGVQFAPFAHLFAADTQRNRHVAHGFHLEQLGLVKGHLRGAATVVLVRVLVVDVVQLGGAILVQVFRRRVPRGPVQACVPRVDACHVVSRFESVWDVVATVAVETFCRASLITFWLVWFFLTFVEHDLIFSLFFLLISLVLLHYFVYHLKSYSFVVQVRLGHINPNSWWFWNRSDQQAITCGIGSLSATTNSHGGFKISTRKSHSPTIPAGISLMGGIQQKKKWFFITPPIYRHAGVSLHTGDQTTGKWSLNQEESDLKVIFKLPLNNASV